MAMQRLEMELSSIDQTINDINTEFSFVTLSDVRKAIRKGSLAQYGRSYKLSTQEVCYWIREYLKEKNKNLGI